MLRNNYGNSVNRISFSLEVIACDQDFNEGCESPEKITAFAPKIFITMYLLEEAIDFDNYEFTSKPVSKLI